MSWEFDLLDMIWSWHNPILDKIMILLSTLGDAGIFWIAVGLVLLIPKKYRMLGLQTLVAMALTFIVGNLILKNLVARPRPCQCEPYLTMINEGVMKLLVAVPKDYSFPSGHSMNGFTAAVTLLLGDKRLGIPAVILATLIAFSRLYNFVHFPTDVLAGIVIGILSAIVTWAVFKRFQKKKEAEVGR